jgi:sugar lactone lactonase YvrE
LTLNKYERITWGIQMVTPTEDYYADHDGGKIAPIECTTVATWKARAFVENLAIDAEGAVFVSVHSHNRIDHYDPATHTTTTTFAEVPAPPMGLAFDADGVLWTTGGTLRKGPGYIWRVERSGAVQQWCELPDALFMNGCTMHPNGRTLLACESSAGRILAIDLGQPGRWEVWLEGDRLRPIVPGYPGSNGIKIREGWAWISVSGRRLMVRVPIQPDGSAGDIEIAATRLQADDFAFGMSGSLYITTHPEHTLVRLDPSGARTTLAGPEQGMVGSTACAFGRAPGDEKALYVTTDGGFLIPHESGIQDAKLVRIEVGE